MFLSRYHVRIASLSSMTASGQRVAIRRSFCATLHKRLPVRDYSLTFSHHGIRQISITSPSLDNSASRDNDYYYRTIAEPPATVDDVSQLDNVLSMRRGGGSTDAAKDSVTYNAVWLRENCRCAECYNATTTQHLVPFHQLTPQAFDARSVTTTEGHCLEVVWADGHVSRYRRDWLDSYCIRGGSAEKPMKKLSFPNTLVASRRLWDGHLAVDTELEQVDYDQLTATGSGNNDSNRQGALKALLSNLLRFGFAFIDNVPSNKEATRAAVTTISPAMIITTLSAVLGNTGTRWVTFVCGNSWPIFQDDSIWLCDKSLKFERMQSFVVNSLEQRTFFGEHWEIGYTKKAENDQIHMDIRDTSYLNIEIGVHTDGTYWTTPPGILALHCVDRDVNGQGGETILVDGFHAAERLREVDRDSFDLLTRVRFDQSFIQPEYRYQSLDTVLRVYPSSVDDELNGNGKGELEWIRYHHSHRLPIITSSAPQEAKNLGDVYRALGRLGDLLDSPESELRFRLTPGRVLLVDNWRVLHARTTFTGKRLLCGCFLSRDDWLSRAQSLNLL